MKEFYLRRIERAKRIRLRVAVENTTATIFLISFCQADKTDSPGTWSMDQKTYNLANSSHWDDYRALIEGAEECPKSEYKFAFSEAVKATRHSSSSISRLNSGLPKNGQIKKATMKEYPIPPKVLIKKIEDFLKSADKH